uniref:Uncharacterized protein n=1 Tax=Salmonella phage vB_SEnST11_KE23 TaxID=3161174 RepID=A0AAU8GHX2_9CAUD
MFFNFSTKICFFFCTSNRYALNLICNPTVTSVNLTTSKHLLTT